MFINDFSANVSTLNFGTEKDTKKVHEILKTNGIATISELCHLSKKHIEALSLEPTLVELHLKKVGLSFGMTDKDILSHQLLASELLKTKHEEDNNENKDTDNPNDKVELLKNRVKEQCLSVFSTEGNWPERYYELSKELYFNDHSKFRSKDEKFNRATTTALDFIYRFMGVNMMMIESEKEKKNQMK